MKNLIIITILVALFFSCKKKKEEQLPIVQPTGTLTMHLHTSIDSVEVENYDSVYITDDGRKMALSLAQLYISGVQLVKLDGSIYEVPNKKFLKVFETEAYSIEGVPVGNYKSIRFKVGLDASTNALEPTNVTETELLNKSEMWFTNPVQPNGYVFMNLQGKIDTSSTKNMTPVSFSYKIGTNANFISVTLPEKSFTISKDLISYSHMAIDYSKIFSGIQLNQLANLSVGSVSENSNSIASSIKNNIPNLFSYE
jgi:hypothetical protein